MSLGLSLLRGPRLTYSLRQLLVLARLHAHIHTVDEGCRSNSTRHQSLSLRCDDCCREARVDASLF